MVGLVGCLQAMKWLLGMASELPGRLLLMDGLGPDFRYFRLAPDPHCPVCRR
uniref:hypothetical protein n=1 Tax=Gallaecimonas sp. GXIMD4217 TaxID=3131927 RepID=UPI00404A1C2B